MKAILKYSSHASKNNLVEIKKEININHKTNNATYNRDVPAKLIKEDCDISVYFIFEYLNNCISHQVFSASFKK